ncbi:DUF3311 domain-containing protein [Amycolatopsis cynarae]|uniref:DUF3311 domain-containing protein n=1 Tax=Amycolatopsis cynarae TaxID=2995223 RepID=A0ABY7B152_9PSEU|nr:DUF3311 domain-containing protein [Amycolatopsis sp. HUAS 11-8]WAL65690.1 DUF3311 domain-containing protein [Amycolatopsis sp. HUAS 11-8]
MSGKAAGRAQGLVFNPWNLFLLIPLLMLITPWFNFDKPRLFGLPFFYWYQFAFVLVGVASVAVVYVMTSEKRVTGPDRLSVDDLDEGEKK